MNSNFRRVVLALTVALAVYVGAWAALFPAGFYSSFPGAGLHWISADGPYDEHLIRDVGGLYLGLAAVTLAAAFAKSATPARMIGLGWTLFDLLHLGYHVTHLDGSFIDRVGNVGSLSIALALGILLVLPPRRAAVPSATTMEVAK